MKCFGKEKVPSEWLVHRENRDLFQSDNPQRAPKSL
jgi:hypothetical protein